MAVPRQRITKRRQGNRRSTQHGKVTAAQLATCSNCGNKVSPHVVCDRCGFYKGKKILAKLV
jgi:large subunit ribosomal protein L32